MVRRVTLGRDITNRWTRAESDRLSRQLVRDVVDRRRVNSDVIHRRYLKTVKQKHLLLVKVVASRATRHSDGEMFWLRSRALVELNGRRDPPGRWITNRWTRAEPAGLLSTTCV